MQHLVRPMMNINSKLDVIFSEIDTCWITQKQATKTKESQSLVFIYAWGGKTVVGIVKPAFVKASNEAARNSSFSPA